MPKCPPVIPAWVRLRKSFLAATGTSNCNTPFLSSWRAQRRYICPSWTFDWSHCAKSSLADSNWDVKSCTAGGCVWASHNRTKYPISASFCCCVAKAVWSLSASGGCSPPSVKHPVAPLAHHPNPDWSSLRCQVVHPQGPHHPERNQLVATPLRKLHFLRGRNNKHSWATSH